MDALIASTRTPAEAFGLGDRLGTLEAGKHADITLLNGDPLADISAVGNVMAVFKEGLLVVQKDKRQR